tara:strand:+ start:301 stop:468 length:168 start_codon:yes stop_codon:yes gene_type:complete
MTSVNTTKTRDFSKFGKATAFWTATNQSIITIFLASNLGKLITETKTTNTSTQIK